MEKERTTKDSLLLIILSLIAVMSVAFFIVRLWFPDLLKSNKDENTNNKIEEDVYDDSDIPKISVQELKSMIDNEEEFILVDVQSTEDFVQASLPTAISIPLAEIDQRNEELPKNKKIIATDAGGNCQECSRAVEILRDYGFIDIKKLDGGVNAWANAGYPVLNGNEVTFQNINSDGLLDLIDASEDIVVIDVRDKAKYDQDHIKGAMHLSFEGLSDNIESITKSKKIIIYDEMGNRSKIAVKQFIMKGYVDVINLLKGYDDWKNLNYPIES